MLSTSHQCLVHAVLAAGGLIDACTQAASGVLTPTQAQAVLNQQLLYVIGILLVGGIASGVRAYMFNAAAERVMCRLRVQLFSKVRLDGTLAQPAATPCCTCIWDQAVHVSALDMKMTLSSGQVVLHSGQACHVHLQVFIYDLLGTQYRIIIATWPPALSSCAAAGDARGCIL